MKTTHETQIQSVSTELAKYAAQALVLARIAEKDAKAAAKRAQDDAIEAFKAAGIVKVELADETQVTLVESDGRLSVDAEVLAELVPSKVYDNLTKKSVDLDAFKGAVESGYISQDIADKASSLVPVAASIKVTPKPKKPSVKK
jgi:hypothetical protein